MALHVSRLAQTFLLQNWLKCFCFWSNFAPNWCINLLNLDIFYMHQIKHEAIFFCIGFNVPFNISGHIRTVPACNRGYDNHFIVLSHWNITPQAQSYDIPPGHIILATGQPVFALNYPLYVERFDKGASTTNLKSLVWLRPGIEPGPPSPRHGANALPLGHHAGQTHEANS